MENLETENNNKETNKLRTAELIVDCWLIDKVDENRDGHVSLSMQDTYTRDAYVIKGYS